MTATRSHCGLVALSLERLSSDPAFGRSHPEDHWRHLLQLRKMVTRALLQAEEPRIQTFFHKGTNSNRTVAKFGIAPDFGSGGRGFESHRLTVPCPGGVHS